MLGVGIIAPLLPLYVHGMGATGLWLGMIFSAHGISNTITTPIVGRLSDRRGRKIFLCTGLFSYGIIALGYIWASNVSQLSLIRFLQGIAGAMIIPVAQAYVGDLSPEGEEGKWMGYAHAAFFSGFGFGPIIGGTLTEHFGMNIGFYCMSGLTLLAFLIATAFLPEVISGRTERRHRLSFSEMGKSGMIRGLFSVRLGQALGRASIMTFLPIFAGIYIGLSTSLIGILVTTNIMVVSILAPLGGRLADRFSRKALTVLGSIIFFASLAAIPWAHNFWQLLALGLSQGVGGVISMPATNALAVEEGRRFGMGSTMSILMMAMTLGMTVGPLLAGLVVDFINIDSVFYFGGGIGLIGAILFIWFTKQYSPPELTLDSQHKSTNEH